MPLGTGLRAGGRRVTKTSIHDNRAERHLTPFGPTASGRPAHCGPLHLADGRLTTSSEHRTPNRLSPGAEAGIYE